MSNTPLPAPWDYCYEWDGPFGTRKFSAASHNGSRPDRSVPIYTPDQMHTHAAAVTAAKDARIKVLEDALSKIDAIRNDIIGRQKIGWSSHVYPMVAALDEAGYPGMDYEAARAALGDKTC